METEHGNLQELNSTEINAVLDKAAHGHLACHGWQETYVVPVTYVREGDYIYSHSREGKKIKLMRSHPKVCLQVEEIKGFFNWRSVIVWGRFEELHGMEAVAGMRLLTKKIADLESERGLSTLEVEISAILNRAVIYRIHIEKATGRAEGYQSEQTEKVQSENVN